MEVALDKTLVTLVALEERSSTPFHVVSLIIFALAIIHTLFANHFTNLAHHIEARHEYKQKQTQKKKTVSFLAEIIFFLGEIEVIFALWSIPLFIVIVMFFNWDTALHYYSTRNYIEPLFVVVIMSLVATRPILRIVEGGLWLFANLLGGSLSAWWFTLLTIGPLLGSLITEVGAMTITALLLMRHFYNCKPSAKFAYATLGLLFVNVSVGGLLTNYASPSVLIVSRIWQWDFWDMFNLFGWKAVIGIILSNTLYFFIFRKELRQLEKIKKEKGLQEEDDKKGVIPLMVTIVHLLFLAWIVVTAHYPAVLIGAFRLFLGFYQATIHHQSILQLKRPLMVGMFLAGLLIHGGLQGWWIEPLLGNLEGGAMMLVGMILTPFNDNAAITYLASLIPNLSDTSKYAIVSGVVAGGGLTVIANAPNPAGQALLKKYFKKGVSPLHLFLFAIIPTGIFLALFYFIQ